MLVQMSVHNAPYIFQIIQIHGAVGIHYAERPGRDEISKLYQLQKLRRRIAVGIHCLQVQFIFLLLYHLHRLHNFLFLLCIVLFCKAEPDSRHLPLFRLIKAVHIIQAKVYKHYIFFILSVLIFAYLFYVGIRIRSRRKEGTVSGKIHIIPEKAQFYDIDPCPFQVLSQAYDRFVRISAVYDPSPVPQGAVQNLYLFHVTRSSPYTPLQPAPAYSLPSYQHPLPPADQ